MPHCMNGGRPRCRILPVCIVACLLAGRFACGHDPTGGILPWSACRPIFPRAEEHWKPFEGSAALASPSRVFLDSARPSPHPAVDRAPSGRPVMYPGFIKGFRARRRSQGDLSVGRRVPRRRASRPPPGAALSPPRLSGFRRAGSSSEERKPAGEDGWQEQYFVVHDAK